MGTIYDVGVTLYDTASSSVGNTVYLYHQKTDYVLRVWFPKGTTTTTWTNFDAIDHVVITGEHLDTTEFTVPIDDFFIGSTSDLDRYYCIINNNTEITEEIGTIPFIVNIYDENDALIGTGRFQVVIRSASSLNLIEKTYKMSFERKANPVRVYLNQGDSGIPISFTFDATMDFYNNRLHVTPANVTPSASAQTQCGLYGKRPDGTKLVLQGTYSSSATIYSSSDRATVTTRFVIPSSFTEISGEYDAQIVFVMNLTGNAGTGNYSYSWTFVDGEGFVIRKQKQSSSSSALDIPKYSELFTPKIRFIIEPRHLLQ